MTKAKPTTKDKAIAVVAVSVLSAAAVIFLSGSSESGIAISADEYEGAWPFTVDAGRIECRQGMAAVFTAGDTTYQLNGAASHQGYEPLQGIWRYDDRFPGSEVRVSISDVLKQALELC